MNLVESEMNEYCVRQPPHFFRLPIGAPAGQSKSGLSCKTDAGKFR